MTDQWVCEICTLINKGGTQCRVCETLRNTNTSSNNNNNNNNNNSDNESIEYVWEWFGGGKWHSYSNEISSEIDNAYNNGTLNITINTKYGKYIIDLTDLTQKNPETNKKRQIQKVGYKKSKNNTTTIKNNNNNILDKLLPKKPVNNNDIQMISKKGTLIDNLSSDDDDDIKKRECLIIKQKNTPKKKIQLNNNKKKVGDTGISMLDDDKSMAKPLNRKNNNKRKLDEVMSELDVDVGKGDSVDKRRKISESNSIKIGSKYSLSSKEDVKNKKKGAELNKDLIAILHELSMIERNKGDRIRANAYSKACKALRQCGHKIKSGFAAQKLNGIGKKIAKKIDEILSTGKLEKLENLRSDTIIQSTNELCQIHGIGPKKASELIKLGIKTINDLEKRTDLLNHQQKIGLKYFYDIQKRIPRDECTKIFELIKNNVDNDLILNICGSYRRGKQTCGDVDILVTKKGVNKKEQCKYLLDKIVRKLKEINLLKDDLAHGPTKYMGICKLDNTTNNNDNDNNDNNNIDSVPDSFKLVIPSFDVNDNNNNDNNIDNDIILNDINNDINKNCYFRRIDIKFIGYEYYYAGLLYFTGSDELNRHMRVIANEKGMILTDTGVFEMLDEHDHKKKGRRLVTPKCEKDIFDCIGMDYVEPQDRSW